MLFTNKDIRNNSILLGLFICISIISKIISAIYVIDNNFIIIAGIILVLALISNKFKVTRLFIFFNLSILIIILLSYFRVDNYLYLNKTLGEYILYCFLATYLVSFKFKFNKIADTVNVVFIAYTVLLILVYLPKVYSSNDLDFTMDLSYHSLLGIVFVVFSINNYIKNKFIYYLLIFASLFNIWFMIFVSNNRGGILAFITLLIILIIRNCKTVFMKIFFLVGLIVLSLIIYNSFQVLLESLNHFFVSTFDLRINWLDRFIYQIESQNALSGRSALYQSSISIISEHPLFGIGIGSYELLHSGQYPHNLFLQLFVEHGLLLSTIFIFGLILGLKNVFVQSNANENMKLFVIFFILFFPMLLVSKSYWSTHFFWIYLYITLRLITIKDETFNSNKG